MQAKRCTLLVRLAFHFMRRQLYQEFVLPPGGYCDAFYVTCLSDAPTHPVTVGASHEGV